MNSMKSQFHLKATAVVTEVKGLIVYKYNCVGFCFQNIILQNALHTPVETLHRCIIKTTTHVSEHNSFATQIKPVYSRFLYMSPAVSLPHSIALAHNSIEMSLLSMYGPQGQVCACTCTWQWDLGSRFLCSDPLQPLDTAGEGVLVGDIIHHHHHTRVVPLEGGSPP